MEPQKPNPDQSPPPAPKVTDQEAEQMEQALKEIAATWRKRLADPLIQTEIRAGRMTVSPLVQQLLLAFPPESKP